LQRSVVLVLQEYVSHYIRSKTRFETHIKSKMVTKREREERERRRREPIMLEPGEFGENVENSTKKY